MQDDQLTHAKKFLRGEHSRYTPQSFATSNPTHSSSPKPIASLPPVKKLSWEEMQKRHEKGLCFNCNEHFTPGHLCAVKQIFLIEAKPEGNEESLKDFSPEADDADLIDDANPQILLNALTGYTSPQTMRIEEWVGHRKVLILIDNGSTHNFVDHRIAQSLGLFVTPVAVFWVTVANGERIPCREKHEGVHVVIQAMEFTTSLFSLPLIGLDMVLGVQWLEKLGPVVCDWGWLSMSITKDNTTHQIVAQSRAQRHAVDNAMLI